MNVSSHFSFPRFINLLKLELYRNYKGILLIFEITFGFLFFMGLLLNVILDYKMVVYEHDESYAITLIIGGFIVSSLAFKDLGNSLRRHSYLMLPASILEKFTCMWLLTSLGWTILFSTAFYLYSIVANTVGSVFFPSVTFQTFKPFGSFSLVIIKYYIVLQGIFLLGAAHFKGYALPKTLAVLITFGALCFGLFYVLLMDVFLMDHVCVTPDGCELANQMDLEGFWPFMQVFFWWMLAPLTLILSYMGLKEQEA